MNKSRVAGLLVAGGLLAACSSGDETVIAQEQASATDPVPTSISETAITEITPASTTERPLSTDTDNPTMSDEPAQTNVTGTVVHIDDVLQLEELVDDGAIHLLPIGSTRIEDNVASFPVRAGQFEGSAPRGQWSVCRSEANGYFACASVILAIGQQSTELKVILGDGSMGLEVSS